MRISTLRYFYEVAQIKSISKVATNFHISQPALSNQLFKLESEFGETLFERSNRGVELTEKGKILFKYAKEIVMQYDNLVQDMRSDNTENLKVKMNISSIYANFIVNRASDRIIEIFNETDVYINNDYIANESAMLLNNRADLAIGCNSIFDYDINSDFIGSDKMIIVSNREIELDKIDEMPIALLNDRIETSAKPNTKLKYRNIVMRTDSFDILKGYVMKNDCIAAIPRAAVTEDLKSGVLVDLNATEYEWSYNFYINYKKDIDDKLKEHIISFRDYLRDILADIRQSEINNKLAIEIEKCNL